MQKIIVHTDGGARGNPGPSGIGICIEDSSHEVIHEVGEYIGEGTNNVAEYMAVKRALILLTELFKESQKIEADFFLDSQLVERQLNGVYKIKDATLKIHASEISILRQKFGLVTFTHVRREENKRADELANEAMDREEGKE